MIQHLDLVVFFKGSSGKWKLLLIIPPRPFEEDRIYCFAHVGRYVSLSQHV